MTQPETETDEQRADRLETERDHAAGDHAHCGVDCEVTYPSEQLRNFILAKNYPGTGGALNELLRRSAIRTAAGQDQPTTRAAILRERADYYEGVLRDSLSPDSDPRYCTAIRDVVMGLRRVADETAGQDQPATEGAPLVLPLAQVRFLHETLGRLLPEGDRPHERRDRYAAAMYDTLNVSPIRHPWASLGDLRRIVWHRRADAAMAVADTEQRELRAELSAAYEEANELALHNDATCETVKERDGLLAERDRLRAELTQARGATQGAPRLFEVWLDASDGTIRAAWGALWPDGTASVRNANHPEIAAATRMTLEDALNATGIDKNLRRFAWLGAAPQAIEAQQAGHPQPEDKEPTS